MLEIMAFDLSLGMTPLTVATAERGQTLGAAIAASHLAQAATLQLVMTLVSGVCVWECGCECVCGWWRWGGEGAVGVGAGRRRRRTID